jgi:glycosidase
MQGERTMKAEARPTPQCRERGEAQGSPRSVTPPFSEFRAPLRFLLFVLGSWWFALASPAQSPAGFLQSQSIYQIFTDRFFDGDASNNNASGSYNASSGSGVHGGDFKGIQQKLDYIKALGATAIWISPIVLNGNGEYHGYAGRDFYAVDPHWGTLADLQTLVSNAHTKGLLVIQDVVVNHGGTLNNINGSTAFNYPAGYSLNYASASRQYAAPFNTNAANPNLTNLFHNYGAIQDYGDTTQVERGELSGLDDFRTETAWIRTNLAAVYQYWIQTAGFDGFRVDTVKHTEMGFWQDWCPRIHAFAATNGKPNFFMFGEVFDGNDAKCGSYTGTQGGGAFKLDATLDFPLYFAANSVFATASGGTKQIEDHYNSLAANYDPAARDQLVTFLDNHDVARFLNTANANGNTNRLAVALVFQHTARGAPCVYQGTEQAFNGGADPANREDMFDGAYEQGPSLGDNFNMAHPLFQLIARLNNFRRLYPALRTGTHVQQWSTNAPGLFAYARRLGGTQEVFVVFNTAGSTQTLPSRSTIYAPGTTLVNLLEPDETITVLAGSLTPAIPVPSTTAKIFIAQPQQLPLDPVVSGIAPAHDATNVSALAPLVVQFNQPMDTNSVQAAVNLTPSVAGGFSWNATHDQMTFTPGSTWPGLTRMTVRIADTATAAGTTNRFFAAFESRFTTASASDVVRPTVAIQAPPNGSTVGGMLLLSGTAADNVSVAKVEVRWDTREWVQASGTTNWSASLNSSNFLNGTHTLSARATDTAANISLTNSVTVRFLNVPGAYLQRLAAGYTNTVTDCSGNLWLSDRAYSLGAFGYTNGTMGYLANTVTGICAGAQPLYQRERYSTSEAGFRYLFDCPVGVYETTILEAETYWSSVGQRVFNAFIEGQQVLTNFDILAAAGGRNLPLTRVFTNNVADGQLEILFTPVVDNARVSGVQVRKLADLFSSGDGIPDWWRWAWFDHGDAQADDASRAGDDADGDGATNGHEFLAGTNPRDAASVFRIAEVGVTNGADVRVRVWTVSNRVYQLQRRVVSAPLPAWTGIGLPVGGSNDGLTLLDVGGLSNGASLYRVLAQ